MEIKDVKRGDNWTTITIEMEVQNLMDLGKIEITPRWQATAKSLANDCNINFPILQIDAHTRDFDSYYKKYLQEFIFYFEKDKDNGKVKEDEQEGEGKMAESSSQ